MKISEKTYAKMPERIRLLFVKMPNPGSAEVEAVFPFTEVGERRAGQTRHVNPGDIPFATGNTVNDYSANSGSASRFFMECKYTEAVCGSRLKYCAKTSRSERSAGCEALPQKQGHTRKPEGASCVEKSALIPRGNFHPTVKPISLMRYLCRLVTPPGGLILDLFAGSGSTLCAAGLEGFQALGFDQEAEYVEIANARIAYWRKHPEGPAYEPEAICKGQEMLFMEGLEEVPE